MAHTASTPLAKATVGTNPARNPYTSQERKALHYTAVILAFLGATGLFLGYANPFAQIPPLALLTPACLILIGRLMPTAKGAFYGAWLCGALGQTACLYWLTIPMHDFADIPWVFGIACVFLLGGYLGLYAALFALGMKLFYSALPPFAACLMAGPLWAGLELARGWAFTGFPWVSLSTAFMAWPVWAQGASLLGAYGLSGAYALIAACLTQAAPLRFIRGYEARPSRLTRGAALLLALIPFLLLYKHGMDSLREVVPEDTPRITAGLVQGNVNQSSKWEPAFQQHTVSRYLTLSEKAVDPARGTVHKAVDLLIWPETAMPFYFEDNRALAVQLTNFASSRNVPLLFGAPGKGIGVRGEPTWHNRLWLYTPSPFGLQYYDKNHLVPFGEYVPLGIPIPFIEYLMQGLDFTPGTGSLLQMRLPGRDDGQVALGALICYEAIFPEIAQMRVKDGAAILVNVSNDAWFGLSASPEQHLQLTAMRAVEQNRFILRATNTGISAVIDNKGRVLTRGPLFKADCIVGEAALLEGKTPYHRMAGGLSLFFILCPLCMVPVCILLRVRKQRRP